MAASFNAWQMGAAGKKSTFGAYLKSVGLSKKTDEKLSKKQKDYYINKAASIVNRVSKMKVDKK